MYTKYKIWYLVPQYIKRIMSSMYNKIQQKGKKRLWSNTFQALMLLRGCHNHNSRGKRWCIPHLALLSPISVDRRLQLLLNLLIVMAFP